MIQDPEIFNQIAFSLAEHFESVFYIDLETGRYIFFGDDEYLRSSPFPVKGDDFFADAVNNAAAFIHPDDLALMTGIYKKETVRANLSEDGLYTVNFRAVAGGRIIHMRHIEILCKDRIHALFCLEDIEKEYREKEEQKRTLQSAEMMARRDELTGVKNSNAYKEYIDSIDDKIASGAEDIEFGVVMCDINNLKSINDTRGHNSGDEAIQATSRLICKVFQHSPVFRVGGDEFVVILSGNDYDRREQLLDVFKENTDANRRMLSGPVIASGMSVFCKDDKRFLDVLKRADQLMYENKTELKSLNAMDLFKNMSKSDTPVPEERRHRLDALFGALLAVAGGGYVFISDMRYDFSRWALSLVDDFGLESEYMYHADKIWIKHVLPEDAGICMDAVDIGLRGNAELRPISYRAIKKDGTVVVLSTRGFILNDENGKPEYFGGIIIPG